MRRIRLEAFLICALMLLVLPATVLADNAAIGQIFALGDHVLPGETMTVSGGQLEPGDRLTFRLSIETMDVELGDAVVGADGTIVFKTVVPIGTPVGYASLMATDGKGSTWNANVLIGERAEGPGATAAPAAVPTDGPIGDQAIGLLMAGFGVVLVLVAALWYWTGRRRREPAEPPSS